jgi:SAM-dependent methyltransferase
MKFNHHDIPSNRLYSDLSKYYDYVISRDDYQGEAQFWQQLIEKKCAKTLPMLLELASGPGHLLSYISSHVEAFAIDLSSDMLTKCKQLNPNVNTIHGDITEFSLQQKFDFILLHDSIGHLFNADDIMATFANAFHHLNYGGVFAVSPEFDGDSINKPIVNHRITSLPETDLTVIDYIERHPTDKNRLNVLTSYYEQKQGVTLIEFDRMELGLFSIEYYKKAMEEIGFSVELYTKPESSSTECRTAIIGTRLT